MNFHPADTAVVLIDPQIDMLSLAGRNWAAVGASVTENNTVVHMMDLMDAAVQQAYPIFISPHYFYPADSKWLFNGPLETDEFATGTFARAGALDLTGFPGSGADWLPELEPYIRDPGTTVVSPHKVFGPQTNDLVLQLRKRGCGRVILGGMLANICVESHLRHLLEVGFEVAVAADAVAARATQNGVTGTPQRRSTTDSWRTRYCPPRTSSPRWQGRQCGAFPGYRAVSLRRRATR